MFTHRGVSVSLAGVTMWFLARIFGSAGLEVVGIGIAVLPFLAGLSLRVQRRPASITRRLSERRVRPNTRVRVEIDVRNPSMTAVPFLLLEDRLPPALGRHAHLVVTGVPPRGDAQLAYTLLPQSRGHYTIGPLMIDTTDPFGLTRRRSEVEEREHLLVTPEFEDLTVPPDTATGTTIGSARARQLLRTGEDFYTMRAYQQGDDLRRIHWPSVARTGTLMLRQDEASRRASGLVFLDHRQVALGQAQTPAFERAISCAASVGALFARSGFTLRLASPELPATVYSEELFLDALAGITHARGNTVSTALLHLRGAASSDISLVFVSSPPAPQELPGLLRAASGFGPKLAILVHPEEPDQVPASRRIQLESRATEAQVAFVRSGWDCIVLPPTARLSERWHIPRDHRIASNA
jgi:uncharacterized protein (DUF58 family)